MTQVPGLHSAAACPSCKGDLVPTGEQAYCRSCRQTYPFVGGILTLFRPHQELTIDPERLRLKTRAESIQTIKRQRQVDFGFISRPRIFYGLYLLLAVSVMVRFYWAAEAMLLFFLADWLFYRIRQGRILDQFESNPISLKTPADFAVVDRLYERHGQPQPSMDDWSRLAWEISDRIVPDQEWRPQVAQRYLEILHIYRSLGRAPEVVVDVGASDGQSCWEFGIGAGSTLIGVDISYLLLRRFKEHLPAQVALQADGTCLPLKDESIDFLFCTETLEHLSDPARGLDEFLRVLRPGGVMVVQSPNAHRLRNLNLIEILILPWSILFERIVRKKIVQENTWHNASTYHWDLSLQDYRRMLRNRPVRIRNLCSREFFFPQFLLANRIGLFRLKEELLRAIPIWKYTGSDLVLVAEKQALSPSAVPIRQLQGAAHMLRADELTETVAG